MTASVPVRGAGTRLIRGQALAIAGGLALLAGPLPVRAEAVIGVTYAPTPVSFTSKPCPDPVSEPTAGGCTDFTAPAYKNLWSASNGGRGDLKLIAAAGMNAVRLYDWDPDVDHKSFLDECQNLGLRVMVPISNWFLAVYNQNAKLGTTRIQKIVSSTQTGGKLHPAVGWFAVGNELDLEQPNIPSPGYKSVAVPAAKIVIDAGVLGGGVQLTFPTSVGGSTMLPALTYYQNNLPAGVYSSNYVASINSFQVADDKTWPSLGPASINAGLPAQIKADVVFTEASFNASVGGMNACGLPQSATCPQTASYYRCQCIQDSALVADVLNHYKARQKPVPTWGFLGFFAFNYLYEPWKGNDGYWFAFHDVSAPGAQGYDGLCARPAWTGITQVIGDYHANGIPLTKQPACSIGGDNPNQPVTACQASAPYCPGAVHGCQEQCCYAKPGASDSQLAGALGWACGQGGVDCGPLNTGACKSLNLQQKANYAMNMYWQLNRAHGGTCDFSGAAQLAACGSYTPPVAGCQGCPQ